MDMQDLSESGNVKYLLTFVDQFVKEIRTHVDRNGGVDGYFEGVFHSFRAMEDQLRPDAFLIRIWSSLVNDEDFRGFFLGQVRDSDDRKFIEWFLNGTLFLRKTSPSPGAGGAFGRGRNLYVELDRLNRFRTNDIIDVAATLEASSMKERVMVRALLQLVPAQKELGSDDVLVVSTELESYLTSVSLMLEALELDEQERRVVNLDRLDDYRASLCHALDRIATVAGGLKRQFGGGRATVEQLQDA